MYKFSNKSLRQLSSCNYILQMLLNEAIEIIDITVIEGHRGSTRQDELFEQGKTKVRYPHSSHNCSPSDAVDIAPYPVDYALDSKIVARFYFLAGILRGIFERLQKGNKIPKGLRLRWGGDWDSDNDFNDQTFDDLSHFETVDIEHLGRNNGYRAGIY